jgi:hypothetical protein
MSDSTLLDGKRILVVDDEHDILVALMELLSIFEKRWGAAWQDADKEFWERFRASVRARKSQTKGSNSEYPRNSR